MSNTNIYELTTNNTEQEETIDVHSETVETETVPLTLEEKVDLIGQQLNWLCENLSVVFSLTQAMSQNGGGVRGLMKVMKEMNNGPA